jgi:signal transduction histidine kinase
VKSFSRPGREFITVLGGAVVWPIAAGAQQERMRRIGVLVPYDETDPEGKTFISAFMQALSELGWTDGRNVRMDLRWAGGDNNRIRALAEELVGLQPDIILTNTTAPIVALQRQTRTIPKLDAGALTPAIAEFPISELLRRIGRTFAAIAQEKGLTLRLVSSGAWVRSDPVLLERIVLNLVSNAVRYTRSGGIVIGCRRRGALLRIEVADSGAGIPEDQQRKIFSEFYRLDDAAKTNQAGLGLGLAIVERLCALLDHRRSLAKRVRPRFHCFQAMARSRRLIHWSSARSTDGVSQKPK